MKLKSVVSLGAIVLVLALGSAYMLFGVLGYDPLTEHTTLRMQLTNSGGLGPKSPVLLTGIEVGNVTGVRKIPTGVEVEIRVDDTYSIPVASDIRIESLSALGEPYIEFQPRSDGAPYLKSGQIIDSSGITMPVPIPEVATRAVDLIGQLDPKVVTEIVKTIETALSGTEAGIPRLERASKLLAETLLSRSKETKQLLIDLQAMGGDMAWLGPSLADAGPDFSKFGSSADTLINTYSVFVDKGNSPEDYNTGDGILPFVARATALLQKVGPGLAELASVIQPLVETSTNSVGRLDVSELISQALASVGDDNAIHLRINVN